MAANLTSSLPALAGPGISGGGKGVICRDANRRVISAETLDLWEAREIYGLVPKVSAGTLRETVLEAMENLSHSFRADEIESFDNEGKRESGAPVIFETMQNHAYPFFKKEGDPSNVEIRWLRNVNLTPTNDAYDSATPADCAIEQIISFGDSGMMSGKMLINKDLWDRLDPTNQAALIVHEAYYKVLRYFNAELSSLRTRRAVGLAFNGHRFATLSEAALPKEYYSCVRRNRDKQLSPREDGFARIYVLPIKDPATGQTKVVFQASAIGSVTLIGLPPVKEIGGRVFGWDVKRFDDLSDLVSRSMNYTINVRESVQPEMDPTLQIEKAGPRGKLRISVSAPASVFFPEGIRKVPLACEYHKE